MTLEGWRESVHEAIRRFNAGDTELADLTAQLLYEQDTARQALSEKGYGWIGLPWLKLIDQIPMAGEGQ